MALRAVAKPDITAEVDAQIADAVANGHLVGQIKTYIRTITAANLASGAKDYIIPEVAGKQYRLIDLRSGGGTNFDAGGDRTLAIASNTSIGPIWATNAAANLKSIANKTWNDSGGFGISSLAYADAVGAVGEGIFAVLTGGTTDYSSGEIKVMITVERVA